MANKHLHELLAEYQEPFVLQNYIEERRFQLKRSESRGHLQVQRLKPIFENSSFPASFCKNACFFSFHDSPDVRKSPLVDFSSPLKSPCRNSKSLFIHIPSRTAALLVEAALRIQKQPSSSKTTGKTLGSGFLGSILKRINLRQRNQKPQIKRNERKVSVKDILRWDSSNGRKAFTTQGRQDREEKTETLDGNRVRVVSEMGLSCSCNITLSSVWSENNEDKSEDLETSSSSRSDDSEEMEFLVDERKNGYCGSCDEAFCSGPFRFSLQKSPSPGRWTPEFSSPATSPRRRIKEREEGSLSCVGNEEYDQEEEEDKEQSSPVSVLDPPFDTDVDDDDDDDDDKERENNSDDGDHRHHQGDNDTQEGEKDDDHHHGLELEDGEEEHSYDLDRSFAIVKRKKQQLLNRLRRFERLADLNPIELEKRMSETDDGDDDDKEEECDEDEEESFVETVYSWCKLCDREGNGKKTPGDMKHLILDLIAEEGRRDDSVDMEKVVKNVSKRLESWKGVESDTIDMMVDLDLRREGDEWRRHQEQLQDMAIEIELAVFGLLVEELSDELVLS